MIEQCGCCRYWFCENCDPAKEPDELDMGTCHRHAPSPSHGQFEHEMLDHLTHLSWEIVDERTKKHGFNDWEDAVEGVTYWPGTWRRDWCGEFAAKPEPR